MEAVWHPEVQQPEGTTVAADFIAWLSLAQPPVGTE